jgi:pimeloyl-ACP methyl ester carboxylesterase
MTLDDWKRNGRTFLYRGHSIFYRDAGQGEALLLVHGFPTASWDWHRLWPALEKRHRVIAPDMIGFGFSAKPPDYDYSILDQAALHEELLSALGVERAHVLAHDYGDTVAQELLARYEERRACGAPGLQIRSVCFLNGGLFPETHRARFIQRLLLTPLGPFIGRRMSERRFAGSFGAVFGPGTKPSRAELADFWRLISHNGGTRIMHRLIGYIPERRRHRTRWVGALRTAAVPLRLVNGPEDPVSGAHMAERYRELVPNPDVVLLPGIGHYPQVEDPAGVLGAFLAFADRVEAAAPG